MRSFYFVMRLTLYSSIPLMLVALGGLYSERSGVVNIALEGIMLMGAFVGIFTMYLLQGRGIDGQWVFIFCILLGGIVGAVYSILHAYASVSMSANQIISGTALNLMAPAFAIFIARFATGTQQLNFTDNFRIANMGILSSIPLIGPILFTNVYLSTFLGLTIFLIGAIVLYKTRFGLRLRSCGEHPHAADAAGVNVYHIRYAGVIISGFLAGLGGVILIVATTTTFNASVSGYGFLALAVLISGQWRAGRVFAVAILFGFLLKLSDAVILIPILNNLGFPSLMYSMIPYIATLIILAFTSKKSQAPRAVGEPYDVSKR
ncbi:MAG: ABC transporter permease [Candidatus Izemoplasmataceae bacterium]|uniref:ABC transporter permease n=1 Tax=Liberiplasma polymorphum TaxID=3374570 RepID=UPI003771D85A